LRLSASPLLFGYRFTLSASAKCGVGVYRLRIFPLHVRPADGPADNCEYNGTHEDKEILSDFRVFCGFRNRLALWDLAAMVRADVSKCA
jgi:hypothetical protein